MKTLIIIRHAKSSWDNLALTDHDRPLNAKGIRKTNLVIGYLNKNDIKPDLMISSTAVRAKETAFQIAGGIGHPMEKVQLETDLYHAGSEEIYSTLFGIRNDMDSVMIFGHNPTLTFFVNKYLEPGIDNLPTTGVVSISFDTDRWEKIVGAPFEINFVVFPSMLKK